MPPPRPPHRPDTALHFRRRPFAQHLVILAHRLGCRLMRTRTQRFSGRARSTRSRLPGTLATHAGRLAGPGPGVPDSDKCIRPVAQPVPACPFLCYMAVSPNRCRLEPEPLQARVRTAAGSSRNCSWLVSEPLQLRVESEPLQSRVRTAAGSSPNFEGLFKVFVQQYPSSLFRPWAGPQPIDGGWRENRCRLGVLQA